jgi:hypothetical protein
MIGVHHWITLKWLKVFILVFTLEFISLFNNEQMHLKCWQESFHGEKKIYILSYDLGINCQKFLFICLLPKQKTNALNRSNILHITNKNIVSQWRIIQFMQAIHSPNRSSLSSGRNIKISINGTSKYFNKEIYIC